MQLNLFTAPGIISQQYKSGSKKFKIPINSFLFSEIAAA